MGGWSSKEHFVEEGDGSLSLKLAHQDLTTFPEAALAVGDALAARVVKIDITGNKISDLTFLHRFPNATDLYADENRVSHSTDFPPHPKLRGLSLNKNSIGSAGKGGTVAVERIAKAYPSLAFLSVLHNPGCPSYFIGSSMEDSEVFRMFCVSRLRKLRFLDSAPVTLEERSEADSELGTSFVAARNIVSSSSAAAAGGGGGSTSPRASTANLASAKLHASSRDTVASLASTAASVRPKKEKREKKEKEAPAAEKAAVVVVAEAYGGVKETLTCHRCTAKLVLESSMLNTQRCPSCAAPLMAPVPTQPPSLPPPPPQAQ